MTKAEAYMKGVEIGKLNDVLLKQDKYIRKLERELAEERKFREKCILILSEISQTRYKMNQLIEEINQCRAETKRAVATATEAERRLYNLRKWVEVNGVEMKGDYK